MSLDSLVKNNSYPIVFIGAGMSKRYLNNYPSWIELLESFWSETNTEDNFYGQLNLETDKFIKEGFSKHDSEFKANLSLASIIEEKYNCEFNKGNISIDGFTQKDAFSSSISPFKYALSRKFSNNELKLPEEEEYTLWKNFIRKAQIILTTNYDSFIEESYSDYSDEKLKVYVGQEGFFDNTIGSAELFKIHGCNKAPNSIVINEDDYLRFDRNSVLISAKILSSLVNSPIVFLGYSLSDCNVRKIISDFTSQLPKEDTRISASRIIVVERKEDEYEINEEIVKDESLGSYTLIKTDNYKAIYEKILKINQGLTPYEIRRYQSVMKKLIVSHGEKGSLDSVIISPKDINSLERDLDMNKPVVVAFGDKKYMYVIPDFMTYMKDYIFEEDGIVPSVALQFVAESNPSSRIPFSRHLSKVTSIYDLGLSRVTIRKFENKVKTYMKSLDETIDSVSKSDKIEYSNTSDIWKNPSYKNGKKIEIMVYNIKNFDLSDIEHFMKNTAFKLLEETYPKKGDSLTTSLRKLFYAYDLLKYGDLRK